MSKVIVIAASNNNNLKLANQFEEVIKNKGLDSQIVDLVKLDLPLYSNDSEKNGIPDQIKSIVEDCNECEKFVFITPEYNGGIAPTLNNFIAWVSRAGGKDWRVTFNNKTASIATFSGGEGQHAMMMLRSQLAYIGMNVIGRQVVANFKKPDVSNAIEECVSILTKS